MPSLRALPVRLSIVALLACAPLPAHATAYTYKGGCSYDLHAVEVVAAGEHAGDRTRYRGYLGNETVVYDQSDPAARVGATVRCTFRVYHWATHLDEDFTSTAHGTTLVVAAEPVDITMDEYDTWAICQEIRYDGGETDNLGCVQPLVIGVGYELEEYEHHITPYTQAVTCPVLGDTEANRELLGIYYSLGLNVHVEYGYACP